GRSSRGTTTLFVSPARRPLMSMQPPAKYPARAVTTNEGPTGAASTTGDRGWMAWPTRGPSGGGMPTRSAQLVPVATVPTIRDSLRFPEYEGTTSMLPKPSPLTETGASAEAPRGRVARTTKVRLVEGAVSSTDTL